MTQKKQMTNPLGTDRISTLVARFAVPSIIATLVSAVYNIADQLFIGNAVGTLGNAATNVACCSPDYIIKKGRIPLLKSSLFYISEHSVRSLIFVKHLRMILLFHLDICQKLPHTTVFKSKNIRVVFSGNQLFCSDTVCCKKSIVFLIL